MISIRTTLLLILAIASVWYLTSSNSDSTQNPALHQQQQSHGVRKQDWKAGDTINRRLVAVADLHGDLQVSDGRFCEDQILGGQLRGLGPAAEGNESRTQVHAREREPYQVKTLVGFLAMNLIEVTHTFTLLSYFRVACSQCPQNGRPDGRLQSLVRLVLPGHLDRTFLASDSLISRGHAISYKSQRDMTS